MNKRIGLIAGKSSETLTKAIQSRGYQVVLLCGKESDPGFLVADFSKAMFFSISDKDVNYQEAVTFFKNHQIDGLILGTGIWFALEIANRLYDEGIPISHSPKHLKLFKDKNATKKIFKEEGFPIIESQILFNRYVPSISLPFVVKSNIDLFPVFLCHSHEDYIRFVSKLSDNVLKNGILIEEYVEGNDCTVPVFCDHLRVFAPQIIYWSKQKNYKLEGFSDLKDYLISESAASKVTQICEKLVLKTGYRGVCRFDIRIGKRGFYFLEINSVVSIRSEGSSFEAMSDAGIDYINMAITTYLNNIYESNEFFQK